jgi:hypothetical protein
MRAPTNTDLFWNASLCAVSYVPARITRICRTVGTASNAGHLLRQKAQLLGRLRVIVVVVSDWKPSE